MLYNGGNLAFFAPVGVKFVNIPTDAFRDISSNGGLNLPKAIKSNNQFYGQRAARKAGSGTSENEVHFT